MRLLAGHNLTAIGAILPGHGLRRGSTAFSPLSLFANGEQGAWFDPSDLSTLSQTATGPAGNVSVGDPVGRMEDKSQGRVLGPELVTNGTFDTDSDWTLSSATISGGEASFSSSSADPAVTQASVATVNGSYEVSFDLTLSAGSIQVKFGASVPAPVISSSGSYKVILPAKSGEAIRFRTLSATGTIDNIFVKELPGNHATQPTAASRPILRQTAGGLYYLEFDGVDDFLAADGVASVFSGTDEPYSVFHGANVTSGQGAALWAATSSTTSTPLSEFFEVGSTLLAIPGQIRDDTGTIKNTSTDFESVGLHVISTINTGTSVTPRLDGSASSSLDRDVGTTTTDLFTVSATRRGGSVDTLMTMDLYGLVVVNKEATTSEISNTEAYLAKKSGVIL